MEKIPTIFKRDWDGNRAVVNEYAQEFDFSNAIATEKLDGMNVRVTIRNGGPVRLEKRRNPNKEQKKDGIIDPWYVDADPNSSEDKYLFVALLNTNFKHIPDGEWSGEAIGPKIQGNPLDMENNCIYLFSLMKVPFFLDCPNTFDELKEWLPKQESFIVTNHRKIEGIVWHWPDGKMAKIKTNDFK